MLAKEDYSAFTKSQKRALIAAASFASCFSPMTGSIYYPALTQIAHSLHVSSSRVNLTVTTYLIVQGLAPMMIAGFSDKAGRRPAYFICFTIYIIANLALSLQNNYFALLFLRMLPNLTDMGRFQDRAKRGIPVDREKQAELRKNYKISVPNPVGTLIVLADLETAILLLSIGLALSCFYALSTGASLAFGRLCGFDDLDVSLMFLPMGAGSVASVFTIGKLVDWNYRRRAKRLDFPMRKNRQTDFSAFPIEQARLQIAVPLGVLAGAALIGYGWTMDHKASLAGPAVILFVFGFCVIGVSQCLTILMVDLYSGQPATATAANNLVRCLLGAAATAAVTPMTDAMGNGWAYTTWALLLLLSLAAPIVSMLYGMQWRRAKKERAERKAERRRADAERKRRQRGNGDP